MNTTLLYSLLAVLIVSLISLIGVFTVSYNKTLLKRVTSFLVSLAAATLIGDVFFHILPELYHEKGEALIIPLGILSGIIVFFIMESVLHWHHCHHETTHNHPHPVAFNNLVADALHNFIDGAVIAISFIAGTEIGIATTIAVVLHEIPQEIGDFGILIHAGMSRVRALMLNFISALFAVAGGVAAFIVGEQIESAVPALLAFAAGGFLYIAMGDLIPEIKHEVSIRRAVLQLLIFIVGIGAMYGITFLESHDHGHGDEEEHELVHEDDDDHDDEEEDHEEEDHD